MPVGAEATAQVVFHADDFGMNTAVNDGILHSFRNGLLTSTSLLANAPQAESACREWLTLLANYTAGTLASIEKRQELDEPSLAFDLGTHLNLTQGRPLTGDHYPPELLDQEGNFPGIGTVFYRLKQANATQLRSVEKELETQVEYLTDRGILPTHLNGHQYVEIIPQIAAIVPGLLRRYSIPVVRVALEPNLTFNTLLRGRPAAWALGIVKRHYAAIFRRRMLSSHIAFPTPFFGTSHAGRVDHVIAERFLNAVHSNRCVEIGLHPANAPNVDRQPVASAWFDPLESIRPNEKEWLCSEGLFVSLARRRITLGRLQSVKVNRT